MKKSVVLLSILFILFTVSLSSGESDKCYPSGLKTSDSAVVSTAVLFCGIEIITDGTNAATVVVYDNASAASGTEMFKGTVAGASNFGGGFVYAPASKGIYVDVTGTGAAYIVYYKF